MIDVLIGEYYNLKNIYNSVDSKSKVSSYSWMLGEQVVFKFDFMLVLYLEITLPLIHKSVHKAATCTLVVEDILSPEIPLVILFV